MFIDLEEQRRLTTTFIEFDPVTITLIPREQISDGQGGKKKVNGTPRTPQIFTLIEPGNSGQFEPYYAESGEQYTVQFLLLGEYDAIIAVDDVFKLDGKDYKIVALMPDNKYEKRAVVLKHGW